MPRQVGSDGIRQLKVRYRTTVEGRQIIVPFVGPYARLTTAQPLAGVPFAGFPSDFLVKEVNLIEGESIEGRMEVVLEKLLPGTSSGSSYDQLSAAVFERDWGEERRPVEEHSKCGDLLNNRKWYENPAWPESDANPGYASKSAVPANKTAKQRTWEHWDVLESTDYDQVSNGWTLAQYQRIRQKHEDYPVAFPIAIVTTYHRSRPTTGSTNVWRRETPPADCGVPTSGWRYVKIADRCTRSGRLYTRVQQWRGYDKTDDLFFISS
jgi:hypothetical protein